jgi:hypothetical protein
MIQKLKAIFRRGAFIPKSACALPEESEVDLQVQGPLQVPPAAAPSNGRAEILQRVVMRMRSNPIPASAPRLSRDDLHGRR